MKVYIAGPITGYEDSYMKTFSRTEEHLTDQGYEVLNPTKLPHNHDKKHSSFMREDLKELLECDAVYMIAGWKESVGASFEYDTAKICGIPVMNGGE